MKCCFNGNEGCLREDVAAILLCGVFTKSVEPLLAFSCKLWGMGVTVKGLQLVSLSDQL